MRRIFLAQPLSPQMEVTGADAHHLAHAMRARSGERLLVTDSEGHSAEVQIAGFAAGKVLLRLVRCMEETHEPPCCVELFQCLPKGDKMDFIVQKATELGAARLHPVMSRNAVVRYDEKKARARAARWQKVAAEAAKQCGREKIPEIREIRPLAAVLRELADGRIGDASDSEPELRLFFYEGEKRCGLQDILRQTAAQRILLLVGAEGGFAAEEAELSRAAGFLPVTLGPRILRAETAAVVSLALVQYEKGDLGFANSSIDDLGVQGQPV